MLPMRKVIQYWCLVVSLAVLVLAGATTTHAESINMVCDRHSCDPAALDALFSSSLRWFPGMKQTQSVRIVNRDPDQSLSVVLRVSHRVDPPSACQIDRYINLDVITPVKKTQQTLRQWGENEVVQVGMILPGQASTFEVVALMSQTMPDACQGASTQMDVRLRIDANGHVVNQPAERPQNGSVLGAYTQPTVSAPSCMSCYWWPLYALQIILYVLYALVLRRPAMRSVLALGPIAAGIPIGAQLLYLVINSNCLAIWYGVAYVASANPFCALMLMWSIALYLVFLTLWGLLIYRRPR